MWVLPLRGKRLVAAITACCCQAILLMGYDQGVMSGILGADNQFGKDFNHPNPTTQGTIAAIYDIGCAVGCLFSFFFGEAIGRKKIIATAAMTIIIGTAILTSSTTIGQLYVGRIVTGIGNGINSSSITMYQSETSKGAIRGTLVSLNSTLAIFGLCIAYWLDYGLSFVDGPIQWRLPVGFQAFFAICLFFQIIVLPDSPRWLIAHNRREEGARVIAMLEDKDSIDHPDVQRVLADIEHSLAIESAGGPFRYKELFGGGKIQNFRRICLSILVNVMQQFTGANMINYLAPIVYQNTMGLSRNLSLILGGCTAVTYMFASFIPLLTIDRFGRRPLLMISATGISICFIIASILLSTGTKPAAYGATAMVFLFQVFLGVGFLQIPWLYPSEICTTRIRSRGAAIASFFNWMCVFAVVEMTPPAIANIGWRTFIIFAITNALWVPLVYCFFPETHSLELEEIDAIFEKGGITGGVWGSPGGRTVTKRNLSEQSSDIEKDMLPNLANVVSKISLCITVMFANAFRTQARLALVAGRSRTLTTHATLPRCLRPAVFSQPVQAWGSRFLSATPVAAEQAVEASEKSEKVEVKEVSEADAKKANKGPSEPSSALFITNIPFSITPAELLKKFDLYGDIIDVRLALDKAGKFRGFAHVEFKNQEDAVAAFESALREPICVLGRELRLDFARNDAKVPRKVPTSKLHFAEFTGDESDIRDVFGEHKDNIKDVFFLSNKETGEFNGSGFVQFGTIEQATSALVAARKTTVRLNYARPRTPQQEKESQERRKTYKNSGPKKNSKKGGWKKDGSKKDSSESEKAE